MTYSIKPRGGVVHSLAVAEALAALGAPVEVIALGDPGQGFYRAVSAPWRIVPAPPPAPTLDERVFNAVDALADGLEAMGDSLPGILHTQDCISARAACRVRELGFPITVVRTVHHVDDFSTAALVDCQRRAILEPDRVLVVSQAWRRALHDDYGVDAGIVPNGVDLPRFSAPPPGSTTGALRDRVGATDRFLWLTVGGFEPRKGSDHLVRALAAAGAAARRGAGGSGGSSGSSGSGGGGDSGSGGDAVGKAPMLAVVGGQSFQDHRPYRQAVLDSLPGLGLELGRDVVLLGTVPDDELPAWYHAADGFVFPSISEGWGLVVLEAMAAGLPVVATDIPVFREYLTPGVDSLLVAPGDDAALAAAMTTVSEDEAVRRQLTIGGRAVAERYGWDASARRHVEVYRSLAGGGDTPNG